MEIWIAGVKVQIDEATIQGASKDLGIKLTEHILGKIHNFAVRDIPSVNLKKIMDTVVEELVHRGEFPRIAQLNPEMFGDGYERN